MGPMLYLGKPASYTVSIAIKLFADATSKTDYGAMFAMSTLLSNYYYGENNLRYLTKSRRVRYAYLLVATAMVMAGSLLSFGLIWSLADLVMALMTFMNLYALVRLTPRTLALLRHYQRQRQQNGDPHFFN